MPTNTLTDAAVRAAKPRHKPFKVSDGEGLHLLVQPTGGRLWRLAYRFRGKQKTLALGSYPLVTLANAREQRQAAKRLLREGLDPSAVRKAAKLTAPAEELTFSKVAERWFASRRSGWTEGYANRLKRRIDDDLTPFIGQLAIQEVTSQQLLAALRTIERRGAVETAHRVKNYARDIFAFARSERLVVVNPASELDNALATSPPPKHRTAMKDWELAGYFKVLSEFNGEELTKLALQLIMSTFVRTGELRFARWSEFENLASDRPLWRIPAERMKMRNPHLVPLSTQAIATLDQINALNLRSEFVFPAATRSRVISENTMIYALYRLGYHSRATVHGFRGTASTILNENGFDRDWIERQLAHVERDSVRAAYNAAEWLNERRRMMQWWGDYLSERGLLVANS